MKKTTLGLAIGIALSVGVASAQAAKVRNEPIQPIEPAKIESPAKVELGKQLFFDPRLSMSGIISCNTCHNLSLGGVDNLKTAIGHKWRPGPVISPTVLNSSLAVAQFWDGRAADLKEQAGGPIANPLEMASNHALAVDVINSIPQYREEFARVYGSPEVTIENITDAIAVFEETLVTPNSRFDLWLKGDDSALRSEER